MDNTSVNLQVDHLRTWANDEEVARQIQALQAAGLRVHLQVQEPDGLQLLQQLPAVRARVKPRARFLALRMALGLVTGLASVGVGLAHFYL